MIAVIPLLALLLSAPVPERSAVTTRLSVPRRLTVGDRFELTLVVTGPKPSLVTGPLADSMGVFAVGQERRRTAVRPDRIETTYRLGMAGFRPGTHRLPRFAFLVHAGSQVDTLASDTASVTIASVLPDSMEDIHGLKPAEAFPNPWLWIVPGIALLLPGLAWAARRLYRRLRRIQELAHAPLPPWEEALNALDALPWREWLEAGQVKRYYYALSEVLKRYIERRFEFGAAEQTTTEMLASMRIHKTPMRDEVAKFFAGSDLVKYAKWLPPRDEALAAIDRVREFVRKTKPAEPAPGPAAAARQPAVAAEGA